MEYISLETPMQVSSLVSAFRCSLQQDFRYAGEVHTGWEFVYVESGKVSVGVDNATYILKKVSVLSILHLSYKNYLKEFCFGDKIIYDNFVKRKVRYHYELRTSALQRQR